MRLIATAAVAAMLAVPAAAGSVRVTITNNSADDSLFLTPFLNVFHGGGYSAFTGGTAASAGLERLAEVGATDVATTEALAGGAGRQAVTLAEPTGVGPAVGAPPVFDPGNSASFELMLDPTNNRFVTLLSMIIPSNDTFISSTFELFNDSGDFIATSFNLGRSSVYDAGTENNNANGFGQAFNISPNNVDADGNLVPGGFVEDPEGGVVHLSSDAELATLFGQPIPPLGGGLNSGDVATSFNNLVTVSFEQVAPVPLPAAGWGLIAGIAGLGAIARRKKKTMKTA